MENICIFENQDVEAIRKTAVAGEIYQAIKRINRDMKKNAQIYLFCDSNEEVDIVMQQLENVQYVKQKIQCEEKLKKYDNAKREEQSKLVARANRIQEVLLECINANIVSIQKQDVGKRGGITNKHQLSNVIRYLAPFLTTHQIENVGQRFIFKQSTKFKDVA